MLRQKQFACEHNRLYKYLTLNTEGYKFSNLNMLKHLNNNKEFIEQIFQPKIDLSHILLETCIFVIPST